MNPEFLDVDDVLDLHAFLIEQDGGSVEVRDAGLLESAVAQPQVGFGGEFLHSDLFEMAATSLFHLAKNHPFVDGNKRTALQAALVFLEINGHPIDRRTPLLYDLTMDVTEGRCTKREAADILRSLAQGDQAPPGARGGPGAP